jgi:16S rRNA (guanine966-N2)-methyltransferase
MSPFGLVFMDPPYGKGLAEMALAALLSGQWLHPGAIVVVEEAAKSDLDLPADFDVLNDSRYGDTRVLTLQFTGSGAR